MVTSINIMFCPHEVCNLSISTAGIALLQLMQRCGNEWIEVPTHTLIYLEFLIDPKYNEDES